MTWSNLPHRPRPGRDAARGRLPAKGAQEIAESRQGLAFAEWEPAGGACLRPGSCTHALPLNGRAPARRLVHATRQSIRGLLRQARRARRGSPLVARERLQVSSLLGQRGAPFRRYGRIGVKGDPPISEWGSPPSSPCLSFSLPAFVSFRPARLSRFRLRSLGTRSRWSLAPDPFQGAPGIQIGETPGGISN